MNLIMLKNFNHEMKCAMFAGSIFLIFFTSSIISVARGEAIADIDYRNTIVDVNEELDPPGNMLSNGQVPQAQNEPTIGEAIQSDSPQIGDPSPYWTTSINIWFQNLSNFYDSILSVLGI